ncbi:cell cycle protein, FtsW/RodA/SpoVE family [Myxococcus xanthus DK 1622]|uniref:Probable peptidoglycan glycosyltransferase FtsW n=1 Tax=Myxococcus xanthus (strain DK1622) TaxID=246197 RepID=Q1D0S9_MYXXD|nr:MULTISPECIES: putative lipid II flippase FtsW [Myxococcus]ABF91015.1 cell cycle protein, FtsW/RodA/SpoVE family [Myxococcus xanthus DK 1622]NOJ54037.1 putative lipid II flippase FtsW [Myxococcus xanthus]QPM78032.1 putative lipid II flippase FtsW [Myxococcus xanthus]QQR42902.1 putative lipid II flippase FtsW [Myxococcus xanthus]QVW67100.1 putative lipid II flippase FtsW [Myxococcus xanthus DZ2]
MKNPSPPSSALVRFDPVLLCAVLGLVSFGLVMVYSASAVLAQDKLGDSLYFLKRQLVAAGLGLGAMAVAMKVGWRRLARWAYPLLLAAIVLLVLVNIPGIGSTAGGARRWIRLPGFGLQPAEVAKFAWVVYLSYSLAKKREKVAKFSVGFVPHLALCGILVLLCMMQPDFGSSVLLVFMLFVLLFAAGAKLSYLVGMVLLALPLAYVAIASSPYRMKRILAFMDPWAHRHDVGYQVAESLMSIGSGGVVGLGLGDGRQKLFFLPEAHTDFIFSIIAEETGLIGVGLLVVLYGVVLWRGVRASLAAGETFGTYLGLGISSIIAFQAAVNMCVAMGLLPTKGLTLPFVSYGGSSLVVLMGAAGVLLSLSANTQGVARPSRVGTDMREVAA